MTLLKENKGRLKNNFLNINLGECIRMSHV